MIKYNYLLGKYIGGDWILYIEYEDEKVKELFDDLNDVLKTL